MRRTASLLSLLALFVFASGCATYGYPGRYPDRRHPDSRRYPDPRGSRYVRQVDRDVHDYVNRLDRALRLSNRQERRIERMLTGRTYRLLERTRPRDHGRVYPFPRRLDGRSRVAGRWWSATDQQVERYLSRRQRDAYRYLTHPERYRRYDDRRSKKRGRGHGDHRGRGRGHDKHHD